MLKRILVIFGYLGAAALMVGITAALVAYGNDYTYDFSTRQIIQKGHVIIATLPSGARVSVDGKQLKKRTPYQEAFNVGEHTFELVRDGFVPWKKTLTVVAGRVALANYVIMWPSAPDRSVLDQRQQIMSEAVSKDHKRIVYIVGGADPAVYVLNIGGAKPTRLYGPKPATATVPAETLREVAFADDGIHVLITTDIGGTPVYRLASVGSTAEPVNLTEKFASVAITSPRFSGSNWKQMYWISTEGLRRVDVDAGTASGVLADNVAQFWSIDDRVLYVRRTELGSTLWSLDSRGRRQEIVAALPASPNYSVALAKYRGNDQLAVVPASTGVATLYSDIFTDTPTSKVVAHNVTAASFSPDGHLLALFAPDQITVHDLERSIVDNSLVLYPITDQPGALSSLEWFDNFHILTNREGKLWWSEFDGSYRMLVGNSYGSLPAFATGDEKGIVFTEAREPGARITEVGIR